ncbi:LiaG family protein [Mesobacillus sp.]|uniref:LiaG family protein n=1 Tax=Mesobacillus sp. TaxID=2675271 RepID=UPI0039EF8F00
MKRILVIFLVITGAYIGWNYMFDGSGVNFAKAEDAVKVTNQTENISIDISSVETMIVPEDRDDVRAELNGKGTLKVKRHGDEIEVSVKRKGFFWFNWFEMDQTSLTVYIPEDYDKDMDIELGSGKIDFNGQSADKPMKLRNLALNIGSGRLTLENFDVENLESQSSSGEVEMNLIDAVSGSFDVSSGRLLVKNYSGKLDADVSSGELEIQINQLLGDVSLDVNSGYIGLDLPENADFTLNGKISSGNISSNFQLQDKEQSDNRLRGKHGSGKFKIKADVSSGNINIK